MVETRARSNALVCFDDGGVRRESSRQTLLHLQPPERTDQVPLIADAAFVVCVHVEIQLICVHVYLRGARKYLRHPVQNVF